MLNRVFHYSRERRAKEQGEAALIENALANLHAQRLVALKTFGADDPHIAELDDERAGLIAQAQAIGALT